MGFDAQRHVASPTGASLNLHTRTAQGSARGIVQINHGLAEHAARYGRFADFLAARGFHSYAHDHRGHGLTTAPDAQHGRFATSNGSGRVVEDVAAIHTLIRTERPGLPIILFGHSMGGLIATNYLVRYPKGIDAAAIWNANFSAGLLGRVAQVILAWEKFRLGSDVPSRLLPRLTFQAWGSQVAGRSTPFDWLSRDPDEVRKYIDDPLCGWDASISLWQDLFDMVFRGAEDQNFSAIDRNLPINLVGGARDPATNGGKAVTDLANRLRRMGFSNLVSTVYPETRHESLNEINRDVIMADFGEWLAKKF